MSEREEMITYRVVVNHEEQFSIWPTEKENALGWRDAGFNGSKADALAYINEHWTDMRPLSLRAQLERGQLATPAAAAIVPPSPASAVPVPVAVAVASAESLPDAKVKRGWFGRRREAEPVPVAAASVDAVSDAKPKRGWFGRRHKD